MRVQDKCQVCLEDEDEEMALYSCIQCGIKLCDFHKKKHAKKFTNHEMSQLSDQVAICPQHNLAINIYCRTCESLICPTCGFTKEHKGHDCALIDDASEEERILLPKLVDDLCLKIEEWHKEKGSSQEEDLKTELTVIEKKKVDLKEQVCHEIEKMKQKLDLRMEELNKEIDTKCNEKCCIVNNLLSFKERTQDLERTFKEIDKMSNFEMMFAKVVKYNQVKKDFKISTEKELFTHLSDLHNIDLINFYTIVSQVITVVEKMGKIKAESVQPKQSLKVEFTNLGTEGRTGPTQIGNFYNSNHHMKDKVTVTNGIQQWTVPFTGKYKITAAGACGGSNPSNGKRGGYGAIISGEFSLEKNTILQILVGQQGGTAVGGTGGGGGGGGGASFIVRKTDNSPLLIAAGGNGAGWNSWKTNGPGGRLPKVQDPALSIGKSNRGSGGAGWINDGEMDKTSNGSGGGVSFCRGGQGGAYNGSYGANGGFGGGGASVHEGGGGGGYIGGSCVPENKYDSAFPDYGAISFNTGTNQEGKDDANSVHGYVIIQSL